MNLEQLHYLFLKVEDMKVLHYKAYLIAYKILIADYKVREDLPRLLVYQTRANTDQHSEYRTPDTQVIKARLRSTSANDISEVGDDVSLLGVEVHD